METWPVEIGHYIVRGSFRVIKPARPPHRTSFEDGPQRGRRSTTLNIATIGFDLSLTPDEMEAFALFERDTLIDGTLHFTMPVRVAAKSYETRTCKMVEQYQSQEDRGLNTRVSLVLDVENYVQESA